MKERFRPSVQVKLNCVKHQARHAKNLRGETLPLLDRMAPRTKNTVSLFYEKYNYTKGR